MGLEKDLPPGEQLLAYFRPFIGYLASSHLSPKTIRKRVDNLWILGWILPANVSRLANGSDD